MTTPPKQPSRRGRPSAITALGLTGAPGVPAAIGQAPPAPPVPDRVASQPQEAETSRPREAVRPRPREATPLPASGERISYTLRMTEDEADALDDLIRAIRRPAGRRRLDKSDAIRALLRLAQRDDAIRAALVAELRTPPSGS